MKRTFVILTLVLLLGVLQLGVQAQGGETLVLNEAKLGTVTAGGTVPSYVFNATAGQQVEIEVITLTTGLNLSYTVFNPAGALIVAVGNPSGQSTITGTVTFTENVAYSIQLSASGAPEGQFLITVKSAGLSGEPPVFLGENQSFDDNVNVGGALRYSFASNPATPLQISIVSNDPQRGPAISLTTDTGKILATISGEIPSFTLRIPPNAGANYILTVSNDHPTGQTINYTISLAPPTPDGELPTGGPSGPAATEEPDDDGLIDLPTTGPCVLATQGQIVNVRQGPSTNYDQVGSIGAFTIYNVTGRNEDGSWYQINAQPEIGWVAIAVTRQGGNCDSLALATYPPLRKSAINGTVWHDLCATPFGPVDSPPTGCVDDGDGSYRANGSYDSGEPGIGGIVVSLGEGACPSTGLATATTSGGYFSFEQLTSGTYCVSVDALSSTNSGYLIPGGWTSPFTNSATASITVTLGDVDTRTVNFGWDYQFLP